ncbi:hypothetical protein F5Y12DRAFT_711994 [Xylaria sp. FL1777]|nr:hypothetical protein F5Y12DRAFT_711994 [Xylaria sp. FL1777]
MPFNDGQITRLQGEETPIFPSNSTSYKARTDDGVEIFVKETPFTKDEEHGAELAAKFFPRVMNPRIAAEGELVYPLFRGTTKSDIRLSYIRSGYKDRDLAQRLLHAEMVQAEDTLRAYRQSLSLTGSSIDSMELPGVEHAIPFDQLLTLRWRINGQRYASLQDAFHYARSVVEPGSPYLQASPTVFGLGHGQGDNIMLSDTFRRKGGVGKVLFI